VTLFHQASALRRGLIWRTLNGQWGEIPSYVVLAQTPAGCRGATGAPSLSGWLVLSGSFPVPGLHSLPPSLSDTIEEAVTTHLGALNNANSDRNLFGCYKS